MIELLTADTPNGKKISIMLEEIGFKYKVTKINLNPGGEFSKGEQFKPEFRRISPFSKIPVIIDHDNNEEAVFESGALCVLRPKMALPQIRQTQRWPEKHEDDWHNYQRFDHYLHQKEHLPVCHQYSESDHQNRPVVPVPAVRRVPSDILIRAKDILYNALAVHGRLPDHIQRWKAVLLELGFSLSQTK